jgi:hypothetical protein
MIFTNPKLETQVGLNSIVGTKFADGPYPAVPGQTILADLLNNLETMTAQHFVNVKKQYKEAADQFMRAFAPIPQIINDLTETISKLSQSKEPA